MEKAGEGKGGQGDGQNWDKLRTERIREAVPRSCLVLLSTAHWDIQLSMELQNIISHICSLRVTFLCFTNSLNFSRWFSDMFKGNVYEWTWTTIVHVNGSSCSEKWQTILVHSCVFKPFYLTGTNWHNWKSRYSTECKYACLQSDTEIYILQMISTMLYSF